MQHDYEEKDGIVEAPFVGDLGPVKMAKLLADTLAKTSRLADKGIPVRILCDSSQFGKLLAPMKSMIVRGLKDLEVRKVAFYGAPATYVELRDEIAELAGLKGKMQHFESREEAIAWLKTE